MISEIGFFSHSIFKNYLSNNFDFSNYIQINILENTKLMIHFVFMRKKFLSSSVRIKNLRNEILEMRSGERFLLENIPNEIVKGTRPRIKSEGESFRAIWI